jgi:hypothetical protein
MLTIQKTDSIKLAYSPVSGKLYAIQLKKYLQREKRETLLKLNKGMSDLDVHKALITLYRRG